VRVLVTGASGHIASALIPELLAHGHEVVGLARSDAAAATVAGLGAEVRRGELADLEGLGAAAADADGVIHLAYDHAAMAAGRMDEAVATDRAATAALGAALRGSGKPLVGTSGTLVFAFTGLGGRVGTEDDLMPGGGRADTENDTLALAEHGVRASVVRLAPLVHSELDHHGFTASLVGFAREHGVAAYVGDGANRWSAAHTRDVAVLYRLALESAPAGARLHGVGDERLSFRLIAETIAARVGVEARSVTAAEAPAVLGFLGPFATLDAPVSNARTRERMGWAPAHPGWVEDVAAGVYG
jgi:nucleoside-diphosphate-sugar epimerase